MVTDPLKVT